MLINNFKTRSLINTIFKENHVLTKPQSIALLLNGLVSIIIMSIQPLIWVIYPKLILNTLLESQHQQAIFWVILMVCSNTICDISLSSLNNWRNIQYKKIVLILRAVIENKAMQLNYEEFESAKLQEEFAFSLKCLERNSLAKGIDAIIRFASCCITMISLVFLFSQLKWWVWCGFILLAIFSAISETIRIRYVFESSEKENQIEMRMCYSRDFLTGKNFAKEVRLFGLYDYIVAKAHYYITQLRIVQLKTANKIFKALWWTYLIQGIEMIFIYGYFVVQCVKKIIPISDFAMLASGAFQFVTCLREGTIACITLQNENRYLASLGAFLTGHEDNHDASNKQNNKTDDFSEITFQNISFRYQNQENLVIDNVSTTLKKGKKYAIVGRNGAGKTTFIKLLMGLYQPENGEILLNGTPISQHDLNQYINYFSPVFQDYTVLGYTISENVSFEEDDKRSSDADNNIWNSLKKSGLSQEDENPQNILNTIISRELDSKGIELSGGQQQKLMIARAIYKNTLIFVLDEPTAALSPKSEYDIYQRFQEITQDKTVIYISHRLASCQLCDEIFVFDNGKIVQTGSHEELMKQPGLYQEMFTLQAKLYQEELHNENT